MSPVRLHSRLALGTVCLVLFAVLLGAPGACAHGAWRVAGPLTAPTAPLLGGRVDTPTAADLSYDAASQTAHLRLDFSGAPSRHAIGIVAGTTQDDGTCLPGGLAIDIASQDHLITQTTTVTSRTWVPGRTELGWSWSQRYPPGYGDWTYLGYDSWTMRYQWLHVIPGAWVLASHDETSTGPDPLRLERTADLSIANADGVLTDTQVLANAADSLAWTFSSPLLDETSASCLVLHVAQRRAPFVLLGDSVTASLMTAEERHATPRTRVRRRQHTLVLRCRGKAVSLQIRIGSRRTAALPFDRELRIHTTATPATIAVRYFKAHRWTPWRTVLVH